MLNPALGDAPARPTVLAPTSTVTEPPTSSYERISVTGALVVVVVVVVVVAAGGRVVVVLTLGTEVVDAMMVVVVDVAGAAGVPVVGTTGSVVGVAGPASEVAIVVVGTMALGVSVTWSRTLPTAAAATNTAVAVTASQIRAKARRCTPP
jgi:hypothetical protein